jgi:hypothetical protein
MANPARLLVYRGIPEGAHLEFRVTITRLTGLPRVRTPSLVAVTDLTKEQLTDELVGIFNAEKGVSAISVRTVVLISPTPVEQDLLLELVDPVTSARSMTIEE